MAKKSINLKISVVCLALNILIIVILLILNDKIPPVTPLLYGAPSGVEQLVSKNFLIVVPAISIIFIIFNYLISINIKDKFLSHALISTSTVTTILGIISIVKIIFLIGNI